MIDKEDLFVGNKVYTVPHGDSLNKPQQNIKQSNPYQTAVGIDFDEEVF